VTRLPYWWSDFDFLEGFPSPVRPHSFCGSSSLRYNVRMSIFSRTEAWRWPLTTTTEGRDQECSELYPHIWAELPHEKLHRYSSIKVCSERLCNPRNFRVVNRPEREANHINLLPSLRMRLSLCYTQDTYTFMNRQTPTKLKYHCREVFLYTSPSPSSGPLIWPHL
jgi:hypothetical protein